MRSWMKTAALLLLSSTTVCGASLVRATTPPPAATTPSPAPAGALAYRCITFWDEPAPADACASVGLSSTAADAHSGAGVASAAGNASTLFGVASVQAQQKEKKKRVPKEPEKAKPEETSTESDEDSSCFESCLGDLITSFFSSSPEETPAPQGLSPTVTLPPIALPPERRRVIGLGTIQHVDSVRVMVAVWPGPGGASAGYVPLTYLSPGTNVQLTDLVQTPGGDWAEVRSAADVSLSGWTEAEHVDWVPAPPSVGASGTASDEPVVSGILSIGQTPAKRFWTPEPPRFGLQADLSYFYMVGPDEVRQEYDKGGGRLGVSVSWVPTGTLLLGLSSGIALAPGEPLYNYETEPVGDSPPDSSKVDSPHDSFLSMFDIGLRIGQHAMVTPGGARLYWGLGPSLYWVNESATIDTYVLPSEIPTGAREETLTQWRLGGEAVFGLTWQLKRQGNLGFLLRGFVIPWEGHEEKSLTLDFIGHKSLAGLGISLVWTRDVF